MYFLCLFTCFLGFSGAFQSVVARVTLSTNVSSTQVGAYIKLRCELSGYSGNEAFNVNFYESLDGKHAFADFSVTPQANETYFENQCNLPHLTRHPVSSTFPVYEIAVSSATAQTQHFWCQQYNYRVNGNSKNVSVSVTPKAPSTTLTANTTVVTLKHPFSVTCTVKNVALPLPVNYSVRFHSQRDGRLASVVFTRGAAPLLLRELLDSIDVSPGDREVFPTFDLELTEKLDTATAYWCTFEEPKKGLVVRSNVWPQLVSFTSSKGNGNEYLGACEVGTGVEVAGQKYSVQFRTDRGPKETNLLAQYVFRPNRVEEFDTHLVSPWTEIKHGPSTAWPSFSIFASKNETALHATWWCVLTVGEQGAPGYRELTSNKAEL